jgi:membrane protein DedA with SNARE-associated domain
MDRLFQFLSDLSGGAAYTIIFGILVACGLGFPLPEDIPLIAGGYLVWAGEATFTTMLLVTMSGVIIGDTILFFLGSWLGLSILNQRGVGKLFNPEKVKRVRAYFRKYGDKIVFFARFVAGFRAVAFFMAGAMHMKYRRFVLLDGLAALLSVPIWIGVGYALGHFFGDDIQASLRRMHQIKGWVTGLIVVAVVVVIVKILVQYKRAKDRKVVQRHIS